MGAHYVKVVEDTPYFMGPECSLKNLVFSAIIIMAIFAEINENECVIRRWSHI